MVAKRHRRLEFWWRVALDFRDVPERPSDDQNRIFFNEFLRILRSIFIFFSKFSRSLVYNERKNTYDKDLTIAERRQARHTSLSRRSYPEKVTPGHFQNFLFRFVIQIKRELKRNRKRNGWSDLRGCASRSLRRFPRFRFRFRFCFHFCWIWITKRNDWKLAHGAPPRQKNSVRIKIVKNKACLKR